MRAQRESPAAVVPQSRGSGRTVSDIVRDVACAASVAFAVSLPAGLAQAQEGGKSQKGSKAASESFISEGELTRLRDAFLLAARRAEDQDAFYEPGDIHTLLHDPEVCKELDAIVQNNQHVVEGKRLEWWSGMITGVLLYWFLSENKRRKKRD